MGQKPAEILSNLPKNLLTVAFVISENRDSSEGPRPPN